MFHRVSHVVAIPSPVRQKGQHASAQWAPRLPHGPRPSSLLIHPWDRVIHAGALAPGPPPGGMGRRKLSAVWIRNASADVTHAARSHSYCGPKQRLADLHCVSTRAVTRYFEKSSSRREVPRGGGGGGAAGPGPGMGPPASLPPPAPGLLRQWSRCHGTNGAETGFSRLENLMGQFQNEHPHAGLTL